MARKRINLFNQNLLNTTLNSVKKKFFIIILNIFVISKKMTIYNAPVEDMLFLYEKLRDNKNYNEIERYKEVTTDLVKNVLEEAAKINKNLIS